MDISDTEGFLKSAFRTLICQWKVHLFFSIMPPLSSEAQVKHSVLTKQKRRQTINSLQETQPLVSKPLGIYSYRGFLCLHDTYKQIQENHRGHCRAASGLPHALLSSTIPSYRSSLNKYLKTQFTWLQTFPVTITSAQIF